MKKVIAAVSMLMTCLALPCWSQNLLLNAGFENYLGGFGFWPQWSYSGSIEFTEGTGANAHSGVRSLGQGDGFAGSVSYVFSTNSIPASPGEQFQLSVWIKTTSFNASDGVRVALAQLNSSGTFLNFTLGAAIYPGNTGWIQLSTNLVATNAATASVSAYLVFLNSQLTPSGGTVYFDDASLTRLSANNAPTNIALSGTNVTENLPVSTTVGAFSTQDPDVGNTFTYTLVAGTGSGDNGSFTISGSNLLTAAVFNYEVKSNYSIRVQSADQGGLSTQKVFAINVLNTNETPTNILLSSTNVIENLAVGTTVGSLSTQDPDITNTFTYTLVAGTGSGDNGSFTISGSNLLTAAIFNYEVKSNYSIRVQSADQGGLSTQKVFAINVLNTNETPTNILLSSTNVIENLTVGTTVGSLSTQDPDFANTFTYTLVAGTGSGDNGSFSISGSNLLATASFDYEQKNTYSIRAQSADQSGLFTQKVFVINITDADDTAYLTSIESASGHPVIQWESAANHTYEIKHSTNLPAGWDGWTTLANGIQATPPVNVYTDMVPSGIKKYYHIRDAW